MFVPAKFVLKGSFAGKSGWFECPAASSGRIEFIGGVASLSLDSDELARMVDGRLFPYGCHYEMVSQLPPAKVFSGKLSSGLSTADHDEAPDPGPCVSFTEATSSKPAGLEILSPARLKAAVSKGEITPVIKDGKKVYSILRLRELATKEK